MEDIKIIEDIDISRCNTFFKNNKLDIYMDISSLLHCHPASIEVSIKKDRVDFLKLYFNYIEDYRIPLLNFKNVKLNLSRNKETLELIPNKPMEKYLYMLCDEDNSFSIKSSNLYILGDVPDILLR